MSAGTSLAKGAPTRDFRPPLKKYFAAVGPGVSSRLRHISKAAGATQLFGAALSLSGLELEPAQAAAPRSLQRPLRGPRRTPSIERQSLRFGDGAAQCRAVPDGPSPTKEMRSTFNTDRSPARLRQPAGSSSVTESSDPLWSVAALQAPGEPRPRMPASGRRGRQTRRVHRLQSPREHALVWFSGGGTLCQTMLFPHAAGASRGGCRANLAAPAAPASNGPSPVPGRHLLEDQKVSGHRVQYRSLRSSTRSWKIRRS